MIVTFQQLKTWPGELTQQRTNATFSMPYEKTLRLVGEEVDRIVHPPHGNYHAHAVIHLAVTPESIRKDGMGLMANPVFHHPGVLLTFDDAEGRELKFHCDQYTRYYGSRQPWRDNFHAIGLTLKGLRDLSRWGAVAPGQQYEGFLALGSGVPMGPTSTVQLTRDEAAAYLAEAVEGFFTAEQIATDATDAEQAYRMAAHLHHPDKPNGNAVVFARVADAIDVLRKDTP